MTICMYIGFQLNEINNWINDNLQVVNYFLYNTACSVWTIHQQHKLPEAMLVVMLYQHKLQSTCKEYMYYTTTSWTLHILHIAVEYEDLSMQMFLISNECFAKQKIFLNNFFITTRTHNTHFLQILTETVTYIYNYWP